MEMKYNSLKEALPSLLEERARLEEEKNRLEPIESELEEQCIEILKELEEQRFDKRVAIGKGTALSSAKNVLVDEEFCTIVRDIKNIIDKETVLLKAGSFLEFKIKNLQSEMTEFACKLDEVNLLIKSIENISLIANMNFKKTFPNHQHLFDAVFNDMLDTNSLAWIYKFSKNNNESLSEENMHNLVTSAIKTNIPAYMYLMAIKIDNIPDEDMIHLIAAIVASNDKKYIDCLLLDLYKKGVSNEVRSFIASLDILVNTNSKDLFNSNQTLANELGKALLEDNLEVLYKHGMYSYEDRAYVLSNIQAGL